MHIVKPPYFLVLAALPLLGCAPAEVVLCPSASVLSDTATVSVFRAGAPHDLSGEAYSAGIAGVTTACHYTKGAELIPTDVAFTVQAVRAPGADRADYKLPYYVAVTQGDRILSKKTYSLDISFASGSASTQRTITLDTTVINLEEGHPATDYQVLVGFQLSDADRAYNQTRRRFAP